MLHKPSIVKLPDSTFPLDNSTIGCASSGYTGCRGQFTCKDGNYNGGCVDTSYTCSSNLAGGLLVGGAVAYTAGIFIVGIT